MKYVVSTKEELFACDEFERMSAEEALQELSTWKIAQFDSETTGKSSHLNKLLCIQLGNDAVDKRILIDVGTIDIQLFKKDIERMILIGQNIKFDLEFLYSVGIVPTKVYDTMIVEQLLHLGYPSGQVSYSLKSIAERRLHEEMDKTVRGQIIWRGLDCITAQYALHDVDLLERIMASQMEDLKKQGLVKAAILECNAVPAIAYLEWCGITLDEKRWRTKMKSDEDKLDKALEKLNAFAIRTPELKQFVYVERQGDLFAGFNDEPQVTINWSSSQQVTKVAKILGFNTSVTDKKTGESKDSVLEKNLIGQKGINDEFLDLYFTYQESVKVVTSFGKTWVDSINPVTGRLHTTYHQLGAASGRLSCGGGDDDELARYKHLPAHSCGFLNHQQLPSDEETRACFIAPAGNKLVSCDYAAEEARLGGDIYQDEAILDMFRKGLDSHSVYAKIFFKEELKDIDVNDVKRLRPDLRKKSKGPELTN